MAERQFIIRIENTAQAKAGEKVGGAGGISKKSQTKTQESGNGMGKFLARQMGVPLTGIAAYATVRKITGTIISHNNSLIEVRTGSREQQERTSFIYNTATGFVDATVTGASAGAMAGGVYGAVAGAAIGVVKQGISMTINIAKTADLLAKQKTLENITRDLQTQRVTTNGSRYMNATQI
jgi:hypothetical protein